MSSSKKRLKAKAERAKRKASKLVGYVADGTTPNERTNYGKRWHARRRGEPMKARSNPPWWMPWIFSPALTQADRAHLQGSP